MSDCYLASGSDAAASHDGGRNTPLPPQNNTFNYLEYNEKKIKAAKAKQEKPLAGLLREPTSTWAGYGFSQSSPGAYGTAESKTKKDFSCWMPPAVGRVVCLN